MSRVSYDTTRQVEEFQIQRLRHMSAWGKLALVGEMNRTVRTPAGLRQRYPDDTPDQRRRRLADLLLGPELAARAYGPWGEEAGC